MAPGAALSCIGTGSIVRRTVIETGNNITQIGVLLPMDIRESR
jgi:hypothetical protein